MRTFIIILLAIVVIGGVAYAFTANNDIGDNGGVACTMEARICPDGSSVGRVPPTCEFAACPTGNATSTGTSTSRIEGTLTSSGGSQASAAIPNVATVIYTSSGFAPKTVIISKGGTVDFVNKSQDGMWIASDPHPAHTAYPGFDQRKSVENGGIWSFTFDKTGSWSFHNHLSPSMKGTVIVQ